MEAQEYHSIFRHEERHWWYVGLRELVHFSLTRFLRSVAIEGDPRVLDAGCGGGMLLKELTEIYGGGAVGLDVSQLSLSLCKKRSTPDCVIEKLVNSSVSNLSFLDASFDAVISLDVLYHLRIADDVAALIELKRILKDGGILVINLSAYEFLSGPHDEAVHTRERYTKEKLAARLNAAGFEIERITYRNTLLFPVVVIVRMLQKLTTGKLSDSDGVSDLKMPFFMINALLKMTIHLENAYLKFLSLPFGSSIFCVARKCSRGRAR